MTPQEIDAVEAELAGLLTATGARVPLSQFRFAGAVGAQALRAILPYQRLPVYLRRYRIESQADTYRGGEKMVSIESLERPPGWVRPPRTQPRRKPFALL